MTLKVGILYSRIRRDEKLLLNELRERGHEVEKFDVRKQAFDIQEAGDGALSDTSDRASLFFFLNNIDDDAKLGTGDTISITVTTASGGTAFVEKRAPSSIDNGDTYRL